MLVRFVTFVVFVSLMCIAGGLLAAAQSTPEQTAVCRFEDGKAITIRYTRSHEPQEPRTGVVWAPGGRPMVLLSETTLQVGTAILPVGAYSLYLVPNQARWELVVNKNVSAGEYEQEADVVRVPMDSGQLSSPVPELSVALGHVAPGQCNLRIYFKKQGMWAEIHEK
jgi:hypothetical protein